MLPKQFLGRPPMLVVLRGQMLHLVTRLVDARRPGCINNNMWIMGGGAHAMLTSGEVAMCNLGQYRMTRHMILYTQPAIPHEQQRAATIIQLYCSEKSAVARI